MKRDLDRYSPKGSGFQIGFSVPLEYVAAAWRRIKPWKKGGDVMDFSEALALVKDGQRVARAGWNGREMFIFLVPGSTFKVNRKPLLGIYPEGTEVQYHAHIDMRTAQGYVVPWLASQADLLAEDWKVVIAPAASQ